MQDFSSDPPLGPWEKKEPLQEGVTASCEPGRNLSQKSEWTHRLALIKSEHWILAGAAVALHSSSCLSRCKLKVKGVNFFFLVRQAHPERGGARPFLRVLFLINTYQHRSMGKENQMPGAVEKRWPIFAF